MRGRIPTQSHRETTTPSSSRRTVRVLGLEPAATAGRAALRVRSALPLAARAVVRRTPPGPVEPQATAMSFGRGPTLLRGCRGYDSRQGTGLQFLYGFIKHGVETFIVASPL